MAIQKIVGEIPFGFTADMLEEHAKGVEEIISKNIPLCERLAVQDNQVSQLETIRSHTLMQIRVLEEFKTQGVHMLLGTLHFIYRFIVDLEEEGMVSEEIMVRFCSEHKDLAFSDLIDVFLTYDHASSSPDWVQPFMQKLLYLRNKETK